MFSKNLSIKIFKKFKNQQIQSLQNILLNSFSQQKTIDQVNYKQLFYKFKKQQDLLQRKQLLFKKMNDQPRWLDIQDELYPQIYLMKHVIFQNIAINQLTEYHIEIKYNSFRRQIDLTPLILKYFIENRSLFTHPPSLNNSYEILIRDQFQENLHFLGLFPHDNSYTIGQNFLSLQILYILVKNQQDFIQLSSIIQQQRQTKEVLHSLPINKPKQIIPLLHQTQYKNQLQDQRQIRSVDQLYQISDANIQDDLQFLQDQKQWQDQKQQLNEDIGLDQKQQQYDNSHEKLFQNHQNPRLYQDHQNKIVYQDNQNERLYEHHQNQKSQQNNQNEKLQDQAIQKQSKSSKRKTIQEILKIVAQWRKLILTKKLTSIEASFGVKMSKRSLQDYFTIIKLGQKYEFDFQNKMKNGFSELRNFVKNKHQTKQSSKIQILQKFKLFKK